MHHILPPESGLFSAHLNQMIQRNDLSLSHPLKTLKTDSKLIATTTLMYSLVTARDKQKKTKIRTED